MPTYPKLRLTYPNQNRINPNDPELLESLKLQGGGAKWPPPSQLTNYNPNAKTDVTLYSQLLKFTI